MLIVACGAALFLGLLALVTDIGWTYYHQLKLQTAVNAGWKAGFDDVVGNVGQQQVAARIKSVVSLNYPDASPPDVSISFRGSDQNQNQAGSFLTVTGTRDVNLFFARIFGMTSFRVQATRSGGFGTPSESGIIPIAIPHGVVKTTQSGKYICDLFGPTEGFSPGTEYLLQPGDPMSESQNASPSITSSEEAKTIRNCGSIDPDNNPGNEISEYVNRIRYGFNQPLQIHDRIILQPGTTRVETTSCIDARIASGAGNIILPITDIPPEVASAALNLGARTVYDLQGPDFPGGKYSPSEFSFTSAVRIIGFAEFELLNTAESGSPHAGQVRGRFIRYIIRPNAIPESVTDRNLSEE